MHGGGHEAVDEHRAGFLVHLVLDRIGVHRDFDDHVEVVWQVVSGGYSVQIHCGSSGDGRAYYMR
jgi:hypothetical protein